MTKILTEYSFKPIRGIAHLDRLDVIAQEQADLEDVIDSEDAHPDWDEIERAVREVLAEMVPRLKAKCPKLSSRSGKTSSEMFPLFAYRDFRCPNSDEALVAGVGFVRDPAGHIIRVQGDLCEEESGRLRHEEPSCNVSPSHADLLVAATHIASRLAHRDDLVEKWLLDSSIQS